MTATATYSFAEAIERIGQCTERWELILLAEVLEEEKKKYSLYHLSLIKTAIQIMSKVVAG